MSSQLQNFTILIVKYHIILNAPPSLKVLSGARENALAHSASILQSSRSPGGAGSIWKYLEALVRGTGVSERFAYGFRTELHFADEWLPGLDIISGSVPNFSHPPST